MENVKNSQNVSVNSDTLNHGLDENPEFLDIPAGYEVHFFYDDERSFPYCTLYKKFPSLLECVCCGECLPPSDRWNHHWCNHEVYLERISHE